MNRKRGQLQGYFAGIVDGEGYIGIGQRNGSTYTLQVRVQMDDPQAIGLMLREYPEGIVHYRTHDTGKPYWVAQWTHYKAYNFLRDLEPFLIIKREQAKVGLSFLAHRRRDHQKRGTDCKGRCADLDRKCKALKRATKGVKTVNLYDLREYRAKLEDVEQDECWINTRFAGALEGVETSAEASTANKAISAPEQDIVHPLAA